MYLLILSYFHISSQAQVEHFHFNHLTVNDGLSQSHVQHIMQDSRGYMWFATQDGLNKWDGYDFKVFRNKSDDTNSISGNRVESILEDWDGTLWIATFFNGLCTYNPYTETFHQLKRDKRYQDKPDMLMVRDLSIDDKGNLWVFFQNGIGFKHRNSDYIEYKHNFEFFGGGFASIYYEGQTNTHPKNKFTDREVIYYLNLCQDSSIHTLSLSYMPTYLGNGQFKKILFDGDEIWFGAHGRGLYKLDKGLNLLRYYGGNLYDEGNAMSDKIRDYCLTKDNHFWIATNGDGVNVLNKKTNRVKVVQHNQYDDESIAGNTIYSVFEDNTGNVWLGHFNDGISYMVKHNDKFESFVHNPHNENSISEYPVLSVYEDSKKRIWIGTDGGGLNLFDKKNKKFKHFTTKNCNFSTDVITAIHEDSNGNLLLGTWEGGLMFFNPETKEVRTYISNPSDKNSIPTNNIWAIEEDRNGLIWLGILGINNAYYFNPSNKEFSSYTELTGSENIIESQIMTIMEDSKGNMWFGTEGDGVFQYNLTENKMHSFKHNPLDSNSLINNNVLTLFEDSKDNIWMGTQGYGVSIYNPKDKTFSLINKKSGLPGNIVQGIAESKENVFWISTTNGICRYSMEKQQFDNYDSDDGLQSNEFKYNATIVDTEGYIFMGGMRGLSVFHPDSIKNSDFVPPVYFTDLKLFSKSVSYVDKGSPLKKPISITDTIILNHKQNVFTISFVALNYASPEKTQYKYKMNNFDEQYIEINKDRSATYMNLKHGEYQFHVMASNSDGVWNTKGATLTIIITPPWWKRLWFIITLPSLVILLVVSYYNRRLYFIRKNSELLEIKVRERTNELQLKNETIQNANAQLEERQLQIQEQSEELRAQRDELAEVNAVKDKIFSIVAHDIRNPFSSLMGMAELLEFNYEAYDDGKRKHIVSTINKSSNMIYDLLTSLLYWSKAQSGEIKPVFENHDIIQLIEGNINLAFMTANSKNVSITKLYKQTPESVLMDRDLVDIVIRNILSNAVKFTGEGGEIKVDCENTSEEIIVKIIDNGIGISPENVNKLFQRGFHLSTYGTNDEKGTGIGLTFCKDLIDIHEGRIWVESELNAGSTFYFSLPLNK